MPTGPREKRDCRHGQISYPRGPKEKGKKGKKKEGKGDEKRKKKGENVEGINK